jgi:pimeloyl-ACP methyl ester carboxylesterase
MLQPPFNRSTVGCIDDLAKLYADAITAHGRMPGYLAGFSVGGIAALETARALQQRGLPVLGLVLVDTTYPASVMGGTAFWRLSGWLVRRLHVQELSLNGRRLGAMFNDPGLVSQVMAAGGGGRVRGEAVERLGGARVNAVSRALAKRGLLAIILVRFTPVAPFAIVNMVAGASQIRLRDLLLGTAIGMTPSTVFMMVFMDRIIAELKKPSESGLALLGVTVLLIVAGGWALKRWLKRLKAEEARALPTDIF